jgi:Tfp pilus assembly protein PilO
MTDEAIFFCIIVGLAVLTLGVMLWIEYHFDGKRNRESYEKGYRDGYEEASVRAYTFTKAFNVYQDWDSFREEMDVD